MMGKQIVVSIGDGQSRAKGDQRRRHGPEEDQDSAENKSEANQESDLNRGGKCFQPIAADQVQKGRGMNGDSRHPPVVHPGGVGRGIFILPLGVKVGLQLGPDKNDLVAEEPSGGGGVVFRQGLIQADSRQDHFRAVVIDPKTRGGQLGVGGEVGIDQQCRRPSFTLRFFPLGSQTVQAHIFAGVWKELGGSHIRRGLIKELQGVLEFPADALARNARIVFERSSPPRERPCHFRGWRRQNPHRSWDRERR